MSKLQPTLKTTAMFVVLFFFLSSINGNVVIVICNHPSVLPYHYCFSAMQYYAAVKLGRCQRYTEADITARIIDLKELDEIYSIFLFKA